MHNIPSTCWRGQAAGPPLRCLIYPLLTLVASFPAVAQPLPTGASNGVVVDPNRAGVIYSINGASLFRSTDSGSSWNRLAAPGYTYALLVDPTNSDKLYAGIAGGVSLSTNGGQSWTPSSSPSPCSAIYTLTWTPSSPPTLYAGGCGMWTSRDGGATWQVAASNSPIANQIVFSTAADPAAPSTVYAGSTVSIFKSLDGGQTWAGTSFSGSDVFALAVDPANSAHIVAGSLSGVKHSFDRGQTWGLTVLSGVVSGIVFDPHIGGLVYVTEGEHTSPFVEGPGAFFRSTNGGQTLTRVGAGLPAAATTRLAGVAADSATLCRLYAASWGDTIYKSTDCGVSWSAATTGIAALTTYGVAATAATGRVIAATGSGVYGSVDGGRNWTPAIVSNTFFSGYGPNFLAVAPSAPSTVYVGAGNLSRSADGGQNWASSGFLNNSSVNVVAADPTNGSVAYAAARGAIEKTANSGASWTTLTTALPTSAPVAIAIDPANPANVFLLLQSPGGLYRSSDGGQNWSILNSVPSSVLSSPLYAGFDRQSPAGLWLITQDGVYRSGNGGQTWTLKSGVSGYTMAFDPGDANTMYVGASGVYKSVDGGQAWTFLAAGLPTVDPIGSLVVDPTNHLTLYAGMAGSSQGGGIYKSTNGGLTWAPVGSAAEPPITVTPNSGVSNQTVAVSFSGSTKLNGAQVKLSGVVNIAGSNITNPGPSVLNASFDLAGAQAGTWNVVITPAAGATITLYNAFTVTQAPPCSYAVSPSGVSVAAGGGAGTFVVTASSSTCPAWTASSNADWLTAAPAIQPRCVTAAGPCAIPAYQYTARANTEAALRSGSIGVAVNGVPQAALTVTQAGQQTCTYSINSSGYRFASGGGTTVVSVTAPLGCPWSVTGLPSWLAGVSGTSGSGTAPITLTAQTNSGVARSAAVTIAGKPFAAAQAAATACGALDVSGSVTVSAGALSLSSAVNDIYSQRVTLTNRSGQPIAGPIYLVIDGVPNYTPYTGSQVIPGQPVTHCQSPTAAGSSLVLWSPGGMASGQSIPAAVSYLHPPTGSMRGFRVFSGTPNQ
jgi:hypothetical protein